MTVQVLDIRKSELACEPDAIGADAVGTYDVLTKVDSREYTFRACVFIDHLSGQDIQRGYLCDSQYREVFKWHQAFVGKICKLVFDVHNNRPVLFPVRLEEAWD